MFSQLKHSIPLLRIVQAVPSFTRWRSGRRVRARPACTDFECHHFVRQDDVFIAPPALVAALQHAVKPPRAEKGTSAPTPHAVEATPHAVEAKA